MAFRARLIAPPPTPREVWPWHTVKRTIVTAHHMRAGERRMDAETYLSSGFSIRRAIERKANGWLRFDQLARAWAPPRIKQIFVDREFGIPYLNTSQVFDVRPSARKWLAFEKTTKATLRQAKQGTILVMASASPGRTTIVTAAHENTFISHHFMRVEPLDHKLAGWLYAFLLSSQGQAMMSGSQYASIIRHIEPQHMGDLPVPIVDDAVSADFARRMEQVVDLRNKAFHSAAEADDRFSQALGPLKLTQREDGFVVQASDVVRSRRRLEAAYHTPEAAAVFRTFRRWESLSKVTEGVWWKSRFKRFYGDEGIPYLSADELFSVNPINRKRILVEVGDSHRDYFVKAGWIVMACSGQVYGLNGAATLVVPHHENTFFSHDLIRIIPNVSKIRAGYLLVALTHRTHGRPLLIRAAYGTSIPHLDPGDVAEFPVVRLGSDEENAIADLAETAASARAEADVLERSMATAAAGIIDRFIYDADMRLGLV